MFFGSPYSSHGFVVLENNKTHCFGKNGSGQLGIGDKNSRGSLTVVPFFNEVSKKVINIGCGYNHTFWHCKNGCLYSSGCNDDGELCLRNKISKFSPTQVKILDNGKNVEIVGVWVGKYHNIFLSKHLKIYTGGYNHYGQLGTNDLDNRLFGVHIPLPEKIISVSVGGNFSFFISIVGNIYAVGQNDYGQLAIGSFETVRVPIMVPFSKKKKIYQVACGEDYAFFFDINNSVYGIGNNGNGELGIGKVLHRNVPFLLSPKNFNNEKILTVKCGAGHTLFIGKKNRFFTGINNNYQLGTGNTSDVRHPFRFLLGGKKIIHSLLLSWSTFHYCKNGELFGCGKNDYGQMFNIKGYADQKKVLKLTDIKAKSFVGENFEERLEVRKERFEYLFNSQFEIILLDENIYLKKW